MFQLNFGVSESRRITLRGGREYLGGKDKNICPKQLVFALSGRAKPQEGREVSEIQLG